MSTLPLDDLVNVSISIGPVNSVRTKFDLALILGKSTVINVSDRVKTYSSTTDMIADGWAGTEPEFIAAQIYFSQNPKPNKVAIGVQEDLTETAVQAMTKCREANTEWFVGYCCGANKEEILEISNYMESASPTSIYAYNTFDSEILERIEGNIAETLSKSKKRRTIGQFSSTDHAIMASIGYAMGANTHTENSAYTLKCKPQVGVKPEKLSSTELNILKNYNCNAYINRGSVYNLFEDGVMADGVPFDEVLNLDMLTNELQSTVIRSLQTSTKIAQTDAGMSNLLNELTDPLEKFRSMGFIAPGIWKAAPILTVQTGDVLERGYVILSGSIDEQSQVDREDRKAPPIYIPIKLAGAIESVSIRAYVNR